MMGDLIMLLNNKPKISIFTLVLFCFLVISVGIYAVYTSSAKNNNQFETISLDSEYSGEKAINALGKGIELVAKENGKSVAEVAKALRNDKTLHVNKNGKLFYKEEFALDAEENIESTVTETNPSSISLENAFKLNSKPDSSKIIFLDFDGHDLSGTIWQDFDNISTAPPWDIDGDPTIFGDNERSTIIEVWRRVAEDYAPFDVNVTTEDPGHERMARDSLADESYGTRALISPLSANFGSISGIAYVGVFDYVSSTKNSSEYYKPALIFPEKLAHSARYIAECVSHEVGHNLGLLHDGKINPDGTKVNYYAGHGTGDTSWAPIMGAGYYRNLTQWSKGEYLNANNKEDDYAIIATNGLSLRADDYSDDYSTATNITPTSDINISGIIDKPGDIDAIAFTTIGGPITLSASPALLGANTDLLLQLLDSSGSVLKENNPIDKISASISTTVPSGKYYVYIQGVGVGDPLATGYTNYGSLGSWNLTGSIPNTADTTAPSVYINSPSEGSLDRK
ncbi:hypothetical protein K0A96_02090, partial [Patescibacteria group bacterium]|nr:hypothetical protein [Patescibacteria group bacterium]